MYTWTSWITVSLKPITSACSCNSTKLAATRECIQHVICDFNKWRAGSTRVFHQLLHRCGSWNEQRNNLIRQLQSPTLILAILICWHRQRGGYLDIVIFEVIVALLQPTVPPKTQNRTNSISTGRSQGHLSAVSVSFIQYFLYIYTANLTFSRKSIFLIPTTGRKCLVKFS